MFYKEVRGGSGYGAMNEQAIDAYAICCWGAHLKVAYEVKVSKGDLRRELMDSDKRWMARSFSNEFYFATPPGLVKMSDIEPCEGLIEVSEDGTANVIRAAKQRTSHSPRWDFVCSLLRSAKKVS